MASLLGALLAIAQLAWAGPQLETTIRDGWRLQSSERITASGAQISTPAFRADGWYPTTVPSTVLAALVANKVYPDPFFGMNLRSIPGTSYPIGRNFSALPIPPDSPFRVPWWYRTEFQVPATMRGKHLQLRFDGLTYRANVWLNGRQIGDARQVAGTFRIHEFEITDVVQAGAANVLAVEVFPPTPTDLALTWVDWNPAPPDKNMGLWRGVALTASGDVDIRFPMVASRVAASLTRADVTVSAELRNLSPRQIAGILRGRIGAIAFDRRVTLSANETRVVRFAPDDTPALRIANPTLWWPVDLGAPALHTLELQFVTAGGAVLDRETTRFGIREITSELRPSGRLFKINGRALLVRGGGWAPDMLLRASPERDAAELAYVRDMHLNTVRLEGKLIDDRFFDLADQMGILVLAGWCCCDQWEQWPRWSDETREIAFASERDQIRRLRAHPSVLAWMNGSDNPPPADVERRYVDILQALEWPNPYLSSATARRTTITGETGVKMNGPYDWVPPNYWLLDKTHGGASGFATEISPGAAVPPIESLRAMLPADHLWPIDEVWNYHAGGGQFKDLQTFTTALNARYGAAAGIEDYAMKAQLMTYESQRAMFEAYGRNKYESTGVIQWMLNNAWPSMIWHLYDYFLRPGGGYFGTKKACEPLHVQYSYDDRSIAIVNGGAAVANATLSVRVLNLDLSERFSKQVRVSIDADAVVRPVVVPELAGLSSTYFVDLRLSSPAGPELSRNFYWLSTSPDALNLEQSTWYGAPVTSFANFTALKDLPPATVSSSVRFARRGGDEDAIVTVKNTGATLAFFLRLQTLKGAGGDEILPVLWDDNYISLLPGESREIRATYAMKDRGPMPAVLKVSGWNVR